MSMDAVVGDVAAALRAARRVLVITGAGISADSGLPTYRGIGGLYDDKHTEDEIPIEVALSGEMMARRPALTWKYLVQIEQACRGAKHNAAHTALAQMEPHFRRMTVLTQNIDGFHRDAGTRSLIEIHGNVHDLFCTECGKAWRVKDYSHLTVPPRCEDCHGPVRPKVVLFGEMLPVEALRRLDEALDDGVDLVMTIGTTSVFPYIAGPVIRAARMGVPTVEINPGQSEVSSVVQHRLAMRAIDVLPALSRALVS